MSDSFPFEIRFLESIHRQDPEDLTVMEMLAGWYTKYGQIEEGRALDEKIVQLDPENPVSHYNLACSLALQNKKGEAVEQLRISLEMGYKDFNWLMQDPDLKALHNEPRFSALLSEFQISG